MLSGSVLQARMLVAARQDSTAGASDKRLRPTQLSKMSPPKASEDVCGEDPEL